jgi:hypothetical protein
MSRLGNLRKEFGFFEKCNNNRQLVAYERLKRANLLIYRSFKVAMRQISLWKNNLVDIYYKCVSTKEAWRSFNNMHSHNLVFWNVMILGHVRCKQHGKRIYIQCLSLFLTSHMSQYHNFLRDRKLCECIL